MPDIAELTNPTGNAYRPVSHATSLSSQQLIEHGNYQVISDETGKESRRTAKQLDYIDDVLPYRLLARTTGADIYERQELLIIVGSEISSHNSITNARFFVTEAAQIRKKLSEPASLHPSQEPRPSRKGYEITELANRLREASGLDIESLARIFEVSRVTYHRWLKGFPVRKRHRDHILEILPLLEEAAQRLGSPEAVGTWLLTPISSGDKKPIEYLAERRYDLFRGFLLRHPTGKEQFRPLKPSKRVFKPRKPEEIEDIREQLRPHTWYSEDDDLDGSKE